VYSRCAKLRASDGYDSVVGVERADNIRVISVLKPCDRPVIRCRCNRSCGPINLRALVEVVVGVQFG